MSTELSSSSLANQWCCSNCMNIWSTFVRMITGETRRPVLRGRGLEDNWGGHGGGCCHEARPSPSSSSNRDRSEEARPERGGSDEDTLEDPPVTILRIFSLFRASSIVFAQKQKLFPLLKTVDTRYLHPAMRKRQKTCVSSTLDVINIRVEMCSNLFFWLFIFNAEKIINYSNLVQSDSSDAEKKWIKNQNFIILWTQWKFYWKTKEIDEQLMINFISRYLFKILSIERWIHDISLKMYVN